jgi:hypothetical protein
MLEQLGQQLEPLADKVDAREVDKKAAFQQIQAARKNFEESFEAILNDTQKKQRDQIQEEIQGFVLKGIGAMRAKLKQAREMKSVAGGADDELKKIFTPGQWQQYEADNPTRKEEMKQKLQQSRG